MILQLKKEVKSTGVTQTRKFSLHDYQFKLNQTLKDNRVLTSGKNLVEKLLFSQCFTVVTYLDSNFLVACFVESSKHSTQNQELSSLLFSSIVYTSTTDIIRFWRKHHWLSANIQLNQWKKYVNILAIRFWKQMIPVKWVLQEMWRKSFQRWLCGISLPTKVCIVKAMVFPVAMYGCKSLTTKKAEHWRTDAFELWCWRRLLRASWTARRSNQLILKEINSEYSLEGLMLKLKLQ